MKDEWDPTDPAFFRLVLHPSFLPTRAQSAINSQWKAAVFPSITSA
jgi:hypothetical protein